VPTIAPRTTELDGFPLEARKRAVSFRSGAPVGLRWRFRDDRGAPVDLTPLLPEGPGGMQLFPAPGEGPDLFAWTAPPLAASPDGGTPPVRVRLMMGEAVACNDGRIVRDGWIGESPRDGEAVVPLDPDGKTPPGVYEAEIAALHPATGLPAFIDAFTVYVEPSFFSASAGREGPPPLRDLRLRLRDSAPEESRLLDSLQFDDAEIAQAVVRVVRAWNESPPFLRDFDTKNFPFPELLASGVRAALFDVAADWYRRNHLAVQAGGVSVADMDKARDYEAAAAREWERWRREASARQAAINIADASGSLGGRYSSGPWRRGWF